MLRNPKSVCLAIIKWIDKEFGEAASWGFNQNDTAITVSPLFDMWQAWERFGALPASGGWLDQPLPFLVHITGMNLVYQTWQYYRSEEFNWSELTPTQTELVVWLEND